MLFLEIIGVGDAGDFETATGISGAILKAARSMFYNINELIYQIMINLYQLFEYLCNARLLDSDELSTIATRVGVILGVVMLFRVIFNFIQLLLDPDKSNDKEIGTVAIIKKCLIVIVMLGMSTYFFDALFYIQRFIIKEQIIYNLILPDDKTIETDNFGKVLASRTFTSFYTVNEVLVNMESEEAMQCLNARNILIKNIAEKNDFSVGPYCLTAYDSVTLKNDASGETSTTYDAFIMDYNFILQTIVGVILVYILLIYAIKVGVRVIQLTVLQIISPMAIVSYLSPKKDNMFSKWWKIYFSTYIDAFIRIAIIYFVIYISAIILDTWDSGGNTFWTSVGDPGDKYTRSIFAVAMIIALLTFAKKAPELIKELLPASASKLGMGASMKDIVGLQRASKIGTSILGGAAGGATIGLIGGGLGGFAGGLLKGGLSGLKGQGIGKTATGAWKNQVASNKRISDWKAAGGTNPFGRWGAAFNQWRGADTVADRYDREKEEIESENAIYKQITGYYDASKKRAESKILEGKFNTDADGLAAYNAYQNLESLKQRAGNIKRSDYAYGAAGDAAFTAAINQAQRDIKDAQDQYNSKIDIAISGYVDRSGDAVIANNMSMAQGVIDTNPNMNFGTSRINNFSEFDIANKQSNTNITDNTNKLAKNKREGESARADAKYSGRK